MPVVRKVQSKIPLSDQKESGSGKEAEKKGAPPVSASARQQEPGDQKEELIRKGRSKKFCHFCRTHTEPAFWDAALLRRYLNDRGRIYLRSRSGCCAKHQRRVSREIKRARHLALLPYTVRV